MASVRLQMILGAVLLWGAAGACAPRDDLSDGPESEGSPASVSRGVVREGGEAWHARPDGPSLFDHVTEVARTASTSPWRAPARVITSALTDLTYSQYQNMRFRPEAAVWHGAAPFELQLFHPGAGNDVPVKIHLVEDGASRLLGFDRTLFRYDGDVADVAAPPPEAGYAGFRVHFPLNDPAVMDEVIAFLGASYFRMVGPGDVYGLSSRGLAVDIGLPTDEEFPDFRAFWVERPAEGTPSLTFYAFLDGPSVTGAYRFELTPTDEHTVLAVHARLFARADITKLGVAPLTSMYLHGTFQSGGADDVRPRVHDSEGLMMHTARGEWIWRPLTNRAGTQVTALRDLDPLGFGLVQRDRDFGSYLDLEARYHRRPSEWVEPNDSWGPGGVELLEFPTTSEFADNVVAYWAPDGRFSAGDEREYRYRLVTFGAQLPTTVLPGGLLQGQTRSRVVRTRVGWDALPGQIDPPPRNHRRVVVDFSSDSFADRDTERLDPVISTSSGTISDLRVLSLPEGGRRATFSIALDGDRAADLRLLLQSGDTAVTETWSYLLEPPRAR